MKVKKIAIVAHCILNQNSVVKGLERPFNLFKEVVFRLLNNNYEIIQLPCPELLFLGINRKGMDKKGYDSEEYRKLCRNILKNIKKYLLEYNSDNQVKYKFIVIGIEGSPTCSIYKTEIDGKLLDESGILMEEFLIVLNELKIKCKKIDFPVNMDNYELFLKELDGLL